MTKSERQSGPEDLAAEYVLGTLDAPLQRWVEERLAIDPALQSLVAEWQERMAALAEAIPPVEPPSSVFERINAPALMIPLSAALVEPAVSVRAETEITLTQALREALAHRDYWLLSFGFFVCGFQVVFIAIHLPAFLSDRGLSVEVGTMALALVGLFNIAGTYLAGLWGGRYSKPKLLAGIYAARALVIGLFAFALPVTAWTAYAFAAAIGILWLGTVPLTNGTVATIFGVRNMSMLTGVVFLFHQLGAFLGGWLGGSIYDRTGSYDAVWVAAICLSIAAALLNLPLREQPVARLRLADRPG